jgi:mRNA interferase HigB
VGTFRQVRIVGVAKLNEFAEQHKKATRPLLNWEKVTRAASWKTPQEMRKTFNSVDYVDHKAIFNVGGNNFRLIASVDFGKQTVTVARVMTHAEYDKEKR